jgi:hypothetical protein
MSEEQLNASTAALRFIIAGIVLYSLVVAPLSIYVFDFGVGCVTGWSPCNGVWKMLSHVIFVLSLPLLALGELLGHHGWQLAMVCMLVGALWGVVCWAAWALFRPLVSKLLRQ